MRQAKVKRERTKRRSISFYNNLHGDEPAETDNPADWLKAEFARRLEKYRMRKNWSQAELARRASDLLPKPSKGQKQGLEIRRDVVSHWSRGRYLPRPEFLAVLAKALDVRPAELMPSDKIPSTSASPVPFKVTTIDGDIERVFLRISRVVSLNTAAAIGELLKKEDNTPIAPPPRAM